MSAASLLRTLQRSMEYQHALCADALLMSGMDMSALDLEMR